jgi:uncharacterized cofD-like protein
LRGLKHYPLDITAVTTMFDSGGSAGVLRDEFGILPPGDIRRCLIALSEGKREQILRDLFAFRFEKGSSLNGHSFGNLLLTALSSLYGSDITAIKKASEILNVNGTVLPVTLDSAHLHATLEDGTKVVGEKNIDVPQHDGTLHIADMHLEPSAALFAETREALMAADAIVFCPGDLYTSLVPNLLVDGMCETLRESKAKKILVMNLMTKWGETHGFKASDFARILTEHACVAQFDAIVCDATEVDPIVAAAYAQDRQFPVEVDAALGNYTKRIVQIDIAIDMPGSADASVARRHDSEKLAAVLYDLS